MTDPQGPWHLPENTRSVEAFLSCAMFLYGAILAMPGNTMGHPAYATLMKWVAIFPGSEASFGLLLMAAAALRCGAVIVNGYWHPNAAIRLIMCMVGSAFWVTLTVTFLVSSADYVPAMLAFLGPCIVAESFSATRCARDAFQQDSFGLRGRHDVRADRRYS